ncbi:MAG: hypothetical protein LQ342_003757 [Letrouitia transgressa]|nr:MAG: hypothetical protein LQ342_003757 [Letrouitia transgressa]
MGIVQPESSTVTRSHKQNDRDHVALADGTAVADDHLPRYFAKSGHVDADPKKVKKEGGGKGNWPVAKYGFGRGTPGEEKQDYGYKFTNDRRRSNSSSHGHAISDFKTKFETVESDPVFEEEYHGPLAAEPEDEHFGLEKAETADSTSSASIEEEDHAKKA